MSTTLPRILGLLALLWSVRFAPHVFVASPPASIGWAVLAAVWIVAAAVLLRGTQVRTPAAVLAAGAVTSMVWMPPQDSPDLALVAWVGLILAVTEGRPEERGLLLRVCVTCVYVFTALAKLNPAFLSGDQITWIAQTRQLLRPVETILGGEIGVILSAMTIAIELWIPLGLWLARTRMVTAVVGVGFHLALIVSATMNSVFGLALLVMLNGLLVTCYLAFLATDAWGLALWHAR